MPDGRMDMTTTRKVLSRPSRHPSPQHNHDTFLAAQIHRIVPEIRSLIEVARCQVASTANLTMVKTYWNIGRIISEEMRGEEKRARYGTRLVEGLSDTLSREYGHGYSARNLWDMQRFYEAFQILQAVPAESGARIPIDFSRDSHLGWTHYRILLGIDDPPRRRFYFDRAASERWATRELQRNINSALFERVAISRDTRKLVALENRNRPARISQQEDVFKDPYILDFLGLQGAYSERDLEASIVRNLETFLSELGTDFCFIARQYPMRIDDIDYFLDLLFYHRGLRCLVAIDLKLGAFSAADKGQMDLYLAWLKEHEWRASEDEPIGLILCTSKRRQHVELLLRHGPHRMHVSEYLTHLPSKATLTERLKAYSRLLNTNGAT